MTIMEHNQVQSLNGTLSAMDMRAIAGHGAQPARWRGPYASSAHSHIAEVALLSKVGGDEAEHQQAVLGDRAVPVVCALDAAGHKHGLLMRL